MNKPTLIIIDLQEAMRAEIAVNQAWANPEAVSIAQKVLAAFRAKRLPVVHIHHHSDDENDGFHPENILSKAMPEVVPLSTETIIIKHGSSGFIGTALEAYLKEIGAETLVIIGGEANMCVESTVRMAGNMGFDVRVVADALVNFQRKLRDGRVIDAQRVLDMSLANLMSFAKINDSADIIKIINDYRDIVKNEE